MLTYHLFGDALCRSILSSKRVFWVVSSWYLRVSAFSEMAVDFHEKRLSCLISLGILDLLAKSKIYLSFEAVTICTHLGVDSLI
jgi:hypothetical protein